MPVTDEPLRGLFDAHDDRRAVHFPTPDKATGRLPIREVKGFPDALAPKNPLHPYWAGAFRAAYRALAVRPMPPIQIEHGDILVQIGYGSSWESVSY